ncbi:hypothetical protein [Campylobacter sp. 19-13652]|uniref:hypothetical protein n=1 Tax=Campylobacter sp. 19-13652 TaxID=2840180 RepID=UPI001C77C889|nr:hypothetical protein [Campylobacter sp. 19-13652]BCX79877.1 hypothetical protein LBC_13390 [Campylobacter sp. 19-13652]
MSVNITALGLANVAVFKPIIERAGKLNEARAEASTLFDTVISDKNAEDGELYLFSGFINFDEVKGKTEKEAINMYPKESAFAYSIDLAYEMLAGPNSNKTSKELYALIEEETGIHITVPTLPEFYKEINVANFIYKTATGELPNKEVVEGYANKFGINGDSQYSDFIESDNLDRILK